MPLIATLGWGTVQDLAGNAVVGATYSIVDSGSTIVASGVTNSHGQIPGSLPSGDYTATIPGAVHRFAYPGGGYTSLPTSISGLTLTDAFLVGGLPWVGVT